MTILRTATGKEFPCNFMGVASKVVLYVKCKISFQEALDVFQNSEETTVLQWVGDDGEVVREERGFIVFTGFDLMDGDDCPVRIRMEKPIS